MPTVAIIADTHIPSRAAAIPGWVEEAVRDADQVIHAGDFDSPEAHERIVDLADGALTAVSGNMDPGALSVPAFDSTTVGGVTFGVTHGTGSPSGYEERVRQTVLAETDAEDPVAVSGHTHQVLDTDRGIRILNPGSATGAWPADEATMMRATVEDGSLDVEVLEE
ncbi:MAG: metallophosphoesterase family protein [Halodesulfurarchaeum sp.]